MANVQCKWCTRFFENKSSLSAHRKYCEEKEDSS